MPAKRKKPARPRQPAKVPPRPAKGRSPARSGRKPADPTAALEQAIAKARGLIRRAMARGDQAEAERRRRPDGSDPWQMPGPGHIPGAGRGDA